jgi:hypothetical protein
MTKKQIPIDTKIALKNYVYALRDPRNQEVFYIGKGVGDRILQHKAEAKKNPLSEKAKLQRINEIESRGFEVEHLFLRTGIETSEEALAIEQAVIDAFFANRKNADGGWTLTNLVAGHQHEEKGLASLETVMSKHNSPQTPSISRPLVVFKLNRRWEPDIGKKELYEAARGRWGVGKDIREKAEIALVIAFGVVRAIYEIDKSGWTQTQEQGHEGKWFFTGRETEDKSLKALIGSDMGKQVKVQANFQKFLDGFDPQS